MAHPDTLRTLIQAPDLLVMPGIFDGFSARLVEQAGFSAGFISGGGLSETLLGYRPSWRNGEILGGSAFSASSQDGSLSSVCV